MKYFAKKKPKWLWWAPISIVVVHEKGESLFRLETKYLLQKIVDPYNTFSLAFQAERVRNNEHMSWLPEINSE